MKARFVLLLFLAVASVGLAYWEEENLASPKSAQQNPYHIPSDKFQTRFETENGNRIRVLEEFDKLSEHLQFLRDYRIVEYRIRPRTAVLPHHSDAEYVLVITRGKAIVQLLTHPNDVQLLLLKQFDVLTVPAGAISYTINRDGDDNLEFIKLALPQNNPGQFQNLYPAGNYTPSSYYQVFRQKTLQAAFNASYEEIKDALWGPNQWKNEVVVKLTHKKIRSLIKRAQSSSTKHGPFRLRNPVEPRYSNKHGSFYETWPLEKYPSLEDLGVSASHLKLKEESLFLPHFNSKGIILAYVADGEGYYQLGSPYPINKQQQQQQEGLIERLTANVTRRDLYIIPAGYPVAVNALEETQLEVVEFMLNAHNNTRKFLIGEGDNVVKQIDPVLLSKSSPEKVKELFNHQDKSYFVNLEDQPDEE
ncbi:hypothetical protein QN277_007488 [Acacia crassicarpa]|uniref:Cupin type-1 domain-containing protein n=1 Tax=Acacia crassicarpa TaxID=499986 RepID=A0AAE1IX42_9FABA|nr:hypothetical protein QN277_007488 [Acacia crassicarpa]